MFSIAAHGYPYTMTCTHRKKDVSVFRTFVSIAKRDYRSSERRDILRGIDDFDLEHRRSAATTKHTAVIDKRLLR